MRYLVRKWQAARDRTTADREAMGSSDPLVAIPAARRILASAGEQDDLADLIGAISGSAPALAAGEAAQALARLTTTTRLCLSSAVVDFPASQLFLRASTSLATAGFTQIHTGAECPDGAIQVSMGGVLRHTRAEAALQGSRATALQVTEFEGPLEIGPARGKPRHAVVIRARGMAEDQGRSQRDAIDDLIHKIDRHLGQLLLGG